MADDSEKSKGSKPFFRSILSQFTASENMTDKQRRILDAALEVFAAKGFEGASTAEIAKRADVAEGTVFKHFKTKKELLMRVVSPFFVRFAAPAILKPIKDILSDPSLSVEDALLAIMRDRKSIIDENWSEIRILIQEVLRVNELREAVVNILGMEGRRYFEEFFRRKIESGELRPDLDTFIVTRAVVSVLVGYVASEHAFKEEARGWDDDYQFKAMIDLLLNGMRPRPL